VAASLLSFSWGILFNIFVEEEEVKKTIYLEIKASIVCAEVSRLLSLTKKILLYPE
jgi:hypothetical protein